MSTPPRLLALDVECVATGPGHNDRAVAQIALVDENGHVIVDVKVRPDCPVQSYLTALTGLTQERLEHGEPLQPALARVLAHLSPAVVLVGHTLTSDVRWLGLQNGVHFSHTHDISRLWQAYNPKFQSYTYFSLEHQVRVLLAQSAEGMHDAVVDAQLSMRLFHLHCQARADGTLAEMQQSLLAAPMLPSFGLTHPTFEGVCMGNRKKCQCGQPYL